MNMTTTDIRIRSCPRCRTGAMEYSDPSEPKCVNCGHYPHWGNGRSLVGSSLEQERRGETKPGTKWDGLKGRGRGPIEGASDAVSLKLHFKKATRIIKVEYYVQKLVSRHEFYAVATSVEPVDATISRWSGEVHTMVRAALSAHSRASVNSRSRGDGRRRMNRPLTSKQQAILSFLGNYMNTHQRAPTMREIQAGANISSSSVVHSNLITLEKKGYLEREADTSRSLRLLNNNQGSLVVIFTGPDAQLVRQAYGEDPHGAILTLAQRLHERRQTA